MLKSISALIFHVPNIRQLLQLLFNYCSTTVQLILTFKSIIMQTILHKANSRGHADHGWLNSYHSFSFAGFYDPSKIHFGALRVLNDDYVAAGMGFGKHPHDNMEIISIPLEGAL